jgi:predicted Rossmann-fold nucleotide-binding protein
MAKYSTGGFVCLPGGYGTFEEMMEMITWNQVCLLKPLSHVKLKLMRSSVSTLFPLWS